MTDPVNPPTDYERYIIRRPDPSDVIKELTDGSAGFASCINGTGAIFGPELHKKMQKAESLMRPAQAVDFIMGWMAKPTAKELAHS